MCAYNELLPIRVKFWNEAGDLILRSKVVPEIPVNSFIDDSLVADCSGILNRNISEIELSDDAACFTLEYETTEVMKMQMKLPAKVIAMRKNDMDFSPKQCNLIETQKLQQSQVECIAGQKDTFYQTRQGILSEGIKIVEESDNATRELFINGLKGYIAIFRSDSAKRIGSRNNNSKVDAIQTIPTGKTNKRVEKRKRSQGL